MAAEARRESATIKEVKNMDCELCDHGDDGEAHEVCAICFVDEVAADSAQILAAAGRIADSDISMTYDSALLGVAQCSFVYWQLLNMRAESLVAVKGEVSRETLIQMYYLARTSGL